MHLLLMPHILLAATQPATNAGFSFSPSPFGATPTPSQPPTSSLFGQAAPQPSPFGAAPQSSPFGAAPQSSPFGASFGLNPLMPSPVPQSQDAAAKEINEIQAAYTPTSPSFKFQYLFLNVVENPALRVKPPNVDDIRWRQVLAQAGGPNNPDK